MDTFTHIVIGACIGEALAGKTFGKRAILFGAVAHSVPDLDVIASSWLNTPEGLLAHRGITHSFFFAIIFSLLAAWIIKRICPPSGFTFLQWIVFFGVMLFLHDFLDAFNNYGVGWFEPFNDARISFNSIYVADPFFTIWPFIAFVALLVLKRGSLKRKRYWQFGLLFAGLYLIYSLSNKKEVANALKETLHERRISYNRYFTTPAPLQNWLWYAVAENDSGYYVGYRSVFDRGGYIPIQYFPRNRWMLRDANVQQELKKLIRFSLQFYTVEKYGDTLVFNDLRFGQIAGWEQPRARFAFHYFLQYPKSNKLVVQRGRFSGWNRRSINVFIQRVAGNPAPDPRTADENNQRSQ